MERYIKGWHRTKIKKNENFERNVFYKKSKRQGLDHFFLLKFSKMTDWLLHFCDLKQSVMIMQDLGDLNTNLQKSHGELKKNFGFFCGWDGEGCV